MKFVHNLSIRRKQTLIIMLTSTAALLLACAAFIFYDVTHFRAELTQHISSIAEILANNSTAAVDFNDAKSAEETLDGLRTEPGIIVACVYDRNGQPFAVYHRSGTPEIAPPPVGRIGHEFKSNELHIFAPIRQGGETIGEIFLASDLNEVTRRIVRYVWIVALVFVASLLVALGLSSRLQRFVSEPILHLTQVAWSVASEKNYSLRAKKHSEDELGQLIDRFNEMLSEIQHRDSALQSARDNLEHRVEERTGELAGSLSLLHATLNSTADGILAVNLAGQVVAYNERYAAMWGFPAETLKRGVWADLVEYSSALAADPDRFMERVKALREHPEIETFHVMQLKDGRTFERIARPQRMGNDCIGFVLSFRDITERKEAEAKLRAATSDLVQASRQAGMAEVATNVLHNVGNVLNSVNTSASVVQDQIRSSRIGGLVRMAALLEENRNDLAGFFTRDNRAEQVFAYLKTLAEHLTQENKMVLNELTELAKNIEHIKEIVAMQQSYAKVSGVEEIHSAPGLVEDALRIHSGGLGRHHVRVIKDFDKVPDILVDKHKVLQILVNLIGNAKYALGDSAMVDKELTLSVKNTGEQGINISVRDNGIGIAPENLVKIFSHGFTTRKTGHGFGLHSGFLAAKEMSGCLSVHSDGLGKGAVFVLELPVNARKKHEEKKQS